MPFNMNIEIKTIGEEPIQWARRMEQNFHFELQNQLNEIGKNAHKYMIEHIEPHKREGATGNLAKSIQFEFWKRGYSCGFWIGDINFLDENAKYWRWQNYGIAKSGRTIPPSNYGIFEGTGKPISGKKGEMWMHTGNKADYLLVPRTPLEPKRFIEITADKLEQDIPDMLTKIDKLLEE